MRGIEIPPHRRLGFPCSVADTCDAVSLDVSADVIVEGIEVVSVRGDFSLVEFYGETPRLLRFHNHPPFNIVFYIFILLPFFPHLNPFLLAGNDNGPFVVRHGEYARRQMAMVWLRKLFSADGTGDIVSEHGFLSDDQFHVMTPFRSRPRWPCVRFESTEVGG